MKRFWKWLRTPKVVDGSRIRSVDGGRISSIAGGKFWGPYDPESKSCMLLKDSKVGKGRG